jgi:hypothetical protein
MPAVRRSKCAALLERAATATGLTKTGDRVLHFQSMEYAQQEIQSDRSYPPHFSQMTSTRRWLDPRTGVERVMQQRIFPGSGPGAAPTVALLVSPRSTFVARDTMLQPNPPGDRFARQPRALDPWAVIVEWQADAATNPPRIVRECEYRDVWRTVIARTGTTSRT